MQRNRIAATILAGYLITGPLLNNSTAVEAKQGPRGKIRDILWVWGNADMAKGADAEHTSATFASASPARRGEFLGTPNVLLASDGIPNDQCLAQSQTKAVNHCPRIVWEIMPDGHVENGDPADLYKSFEYQKRVAQLQKLKTEFPQIEGVLLDDMTSVAVDKGFKPEHIRALKKQLKDNKLSVDVWGVFYTMNFGRESINQYINELDVINLWTWDAKDVVDLEKNVLYCEKQFPGKPIVLGLYLYDYGNGGNHPRPIPLDLLKLQCESALKLAQEGHVAGIVFLTVDDAPEAVEWTADWIKRVADLPLKNSNSPSRNQ